MEMNGIKKSLRNLILKLGGTEAMTKGKTIAKLINALGDGIESGDIAIGGGNTGYDVWYDIKYNMSTQTFDFGNGVSEIADFMQNAMLERRNGKTLGGTISWVEESNGETQLIRKIVINDFLDDNDVDYVLDSQMNGFIGYKSLNFVYSSTNRSHVANNYFGIYFCGENGETVKITGDGGARGREYYFDSESAGPIIG